MAIPDKPLQVRFNPAEITLDELCLFEPDGFSLVGFREFLRNHTNWDRAEIGSISLTELEQVAKDLAEEIEKLSIPLRREPRLETGPKLGAAESQSGQTK
mgnify:CR=1 FL=1